MLHRKILYIYIYIYIHISSSDRSLIEPTGLTKKTGDMPQNFLEPSSKPYLTPHHPLSPISGQISSPNCSLAAAEQVGFFRPNGSGRGSKMRTQHGTLVNGTNLEDPLIHKKNAPDSFWHSSVFFLLKSKLERNFPQLGRNFPQLGRNSKKCAKPKLRPAICAFAYV